MAQNDNPSQVPPADRPGVIDARTVHEGAEVVFDGPRFVVRRVALDTPSGGTQRDVAIPSDAVVILPVLPDGRIGMIRNQRFAVGQTLWELPAGKLDPGEDPADTAKRELLEETGYRADTVVQLTAFYPTPGFCTEKLTAFRAEGLTFEGQQLEDTENIVVEPMSLDDALEMVRDGRIQDAKTVATLLYHHSFGENKK